MKTEPLKRLGALGQSIWLDYISRDLVAGGELRRLIRDDGLRGITSNPSIFQKAIAGSHDYDNHIRAGAREGISVKAIYEALSRRDVQSAADEFRPLYDKTQGADGYVSLEVDPHLAHDIGGTVDEARRLWAALDRPNVFIKVPATEAGLPAIRQLIGEGINVNVTLLFGMPRYRQVVDAYLGGLEALEARAAAQARPLRAQEAQAGPLAAVASVASFFVSRIDALVDPLLQQIIDQGGERADRARTLLGQVAIANAKLAYQVYKQAFSTERYASLAGKGARTQRLLWASTSTKNPEYSDVKYVEALIGRDTVDTVTVETLDAYRDHGEPEDRIEHDVAGAREILDGLSELGIDLDGVTTQLEGEGVDKFSRSFDELMEALGKAVAGVPR